ncbi:MAG: peptidoglycan DD-metalloendopeptidase family protein [Ignavibacteriales bacterium]
MDEQNSGMSPAEDKARQNIGDAASGTKNTAQHAANGARRVKGAVGNVGNSVENAGRKMKSAGKGIERTGKAAEKAGQATKLAGKGLQETSKAAPIAGAGLGAGAGAIIGSIIPGAGTAVGAEVGKDIGKTVGEGAKVAGQATGKALEFGGDKLQEGGKKLQKVGKGLQSAGDKTEKAGKGINKAAKGVAKAVLPAAGTLVGTGVGAALGTLVPIPVVGTLGGAAIGGAIGNIAGQIGAFKVGSTMDLLTNPMEKFRGIFSIEGLKKTLKKLAKKPMFWLILFLLAVIWNWWSAYDLSYKQAFLSTGELVESAKQTIGKDQYQKGYGTLAALTKEDFDRVAKSVTDGKLEDGTTKAKSEIPFFGMNARRSIAYQTPSSLPVSLAYATRKLNDGTYKNEIIANAALNNNILNQNRSSEIKTSKYIKPTDRLIAGFGRHGEFNNLMSLSVPAYAASEEFNLDFNPVLDQVCTEQERDRIITYLEKERNSIILAPIEEKTALDQSILGSLLGGLFTKIFGEEAPLDSDDDRDYGAGNNKIKYPRLIFNNSDYDFDQNKMRNIDDFIRTDVLPRMNLDSTPDKIFDSYAGNDMKKQVDEIWTYIREIPAANENTRMMSITDKANDNGATDDYDMKDTLYRLLEPYALDWKFLYTIDKAIDEDPFDDFKNLNKRDPTPDEIEKIKADLLEKFSEVDIPKFMPQFKVKRHVKRDYTYTWTQTAKWVTESDGNGGTVEVCETDGPDITEDNKFTPEYTLEWIDILTKDQYMPTCVKLVFSYDERKTYAGDGCTYTWTKNISMKMVPDYYKTSMQVDGNGFIGGSSPQVVEENNIDGNGSFTRKIEFEKLLWKPNPPKRHTKRIELKELFENKYGLHVYDIRHALYLMDGNSYFPTARLCIAWIYGIDLRYISKKSNYSGSGYSGDGGGWDADVTFVRQDKPGRTLTQTIFANDNCVNTINQLGRANGIPGSAWAAQIIGEASWDLSPTANPAPDGDCNLSGIKGPGGLHASDGGTYRHFTSYDLYFKYYAEVLMNQSNYQIGKDSAKNGWTNPNNLSTTGVDQNMLAAAAAPGPEAYLFGIESNLSSNYNPSGFSYSEGIITLLWQNKLKASGGGGTASGIGDKIIATAASVPIEWPYQSGGKSPYVERQPRGPLDCSGYVQWVMINALGSTDPFSKYGSTATLHDAIDDGVLKEISEDEVQPGDIFIRTAHVGEAHGENDHTGFCYSKDNNGTITIIHEANSDDGLKTSVLTGGEYKTWARYAGAGGSSGSSTGTYYGVNIFNLPKDYFDSSKDKEKDDNYIGGPDIWAEDFACSGYAGGGGSNTGTLGPNEVSGQGFSWPIANDVVIHPFTRGWAYGWRDSGFHTGVDITPMNGQSVPVYAAKNGKVIVVKDCGPGVSYGKYVQIEHEGGVTTIYAHMNKNDYFQVGQTVTKGQQIGDMGSTGHSTGMHLHFEMRPSGGGTVDPLQYLPSRQ